MFVEQFHATISVAIHGARRVVELSQLSMPQMPASIFGPCWKTTPDDH